MRETRRFTPAEDEFIKANISRLTCTDIAKYLGRNPASIISRATTLGLREANRTIRKFTTEDDQFISDNAGKISLQEISERLGRSTGSVWGRGKKLGVWFDRKKRTSRPAYTNTGYVRIPVETDHGREWKLEHIHVIERRIGRRLRAGEQVHHINLDTKDNGDRNLHLCGSVADHNRAHASLSRLVSKLLERGAIRFNTTSGEYELCETSK